MVKQRYIETVDGWLDTQTGLEWERESRPAQPWPTEHDLGDGWRVPTIDELCNVVDRRRHDPATELPGMRAVCYWSASPYATDTDFAWVVHFDVGYVLSDSKPSNSYLRAVRGPHDVRTCVKGATPEPTIPPLEDVPTPLETTLTKLVKELIKTAKAWQRSGPPHTKKRAAGKCKSKAGKRRAAK